MQKRNSLMKSIIYYVIIGAILIGAYQIFQKYNFEDFVKAEYQIRLSKFERDKKVKCTKNNSYKIESPEYNDAMFYKTIAVTPNTPYKVTCKIKTENVKTRNENTDAGAHICLGETLEKSDNVTGTTDWTKVEFYFNSKNRTEVDLGFRLGGYEDNAMGTAWFSDFTIESGITDETNKWNILCVLFDNTDVNIAQNGANKNVKLSLTQTDKDDISICMRRFKDAMEELSLGKMRIQYDIAEIAAPIKSMSYDEKNGYYVSGYNIKDVLDPYVKQGKYDHIFVAFRTGNLNQKNAIPINDWIGLGFMEYRGIGFSNVRLPDDDSNYIYKYDVRVNTFPEEVLIHEFLHTLERNAEEYEYERPELHDNSKYGYESKPLVGLKEWYKDYINKDIKTSSGKIGLPPEIYNKKPAKTTDFEYSHSLDALKEPENIIEELNNIVHRVITLFSTPKQIEEES